jgi:outer membrane protein assembly factor BamB/orotate phosphoribosyltransferase/threonine dehydrogenase-like Zn-dependent dehydrogenase
MISPKGERYSWLMDLRRAFLDPIALRQISRAILDRLPSGTSVQLAAMETAAIPLLTGLLVEGRARGAELSGIIVRKQRGPSGLERAIEGELSGDPVILIDDIINSGSSAEKACAALQRAGAKPDRLFVVTDYHSDKGLAWRQARGIRVDSLFKLSDFKLSLRPPRVATLLREFSMLWHHRAAEEAQASDLTPESAPLIVGELLYFGTNGGSMRALQIDTGEPVWDHKCPEATGMGAWPSPAHHAGRIYFGACDGNVYCLDAASGKPIWQQALCDGVGSSALIVPENDQLYIGLQHAGPPFRGSVVGLSLGTGTKVWQHWLETGQEGPCAHWNGGDLVVFGTNDNDVRALDARTGELAWRFVTGGAVKSAPAIDETRGIAAVASQDGTIYVLSARDGSKVAEFPTGNVCYATPLIVEDRMFCGSGDRHIHVIDLEKMALIKMIDCGARIYSSPRLIAGSVVFGTSGGVVREIDPSSLQTTGKVDVPDAVTSAIAAVPDGTRIFVQSGMDEIYAFSRRARQPVLPTPPAATAKPPAPQLVDINDLRNSRGALSSAAMVYVGEADFVGPQIARTFARDRYKVTSFATAEAAIGALCAGDRPVSPGQATALVAFQPSASDVGILARQLGGAISHLILISSYKVYPALPRPAPWRAEEFDALTDGTGSNDPSEAGQARAAERELRLQGHRLKAWTILRPALIDGINNPNAYSAWFVNRILDGGPLILPDRKTVIYRHVSAADLARAALLVANREQAFAKILNVVSRSMLTYWGHAALLRDGLQRAAVFKHVPHAAWRAAQLPLPVAEDLGASYMAASELLADLGWEPSDEVAFFKQLARDLAEFPQVGDRASRELERQLAVEADAKVRTEPEVEQVRSPQHWTLIAHPGSPAGLVLQRSSAVGKLPSPVLKARRLAIGEFEARLLRGELPGLAAPRVVGHNAVLEVVHDATSALPVGSLVLPLPRLPCTETGCPSCGAMQPRASGLNCEGYGRSYCSVPHRHLVPIEPDLSRLALLANPLAALSEAFGEGVLQQAKVVWICGTALEAALLAWLAEDSGCAVAHVGRTARPDKEFPICEIVERLREVDAGGQPPPDAIVDFTGDFETALALAPAMKRAKMWWGCRRPTRLPRSASFHVLPTFAGSRTTIERALELLRSWTGWRDTNGRIGAAIPIEAYWDAFLPQPFALPYIEVDS